MKDRLICDILTPVKTISGLFLLFLLIIVFFNSAFADNYLIPVLALQDEAIISSEDANNVLSFSAAKDIPVIPTPDDIPEQEAVKIAKEALLDAYHWSEDYLDGAVPKAELYVTEERPDYHRWMVQFLFFTEGSDNFLEKAYSVIVDHEGQIIADPDIGEKSIYEYALSISPSAIISKYMEYLERAKGYVFQYWPIELKAEFSENVSPLIRNAVETDNLEALNNGGEIDYDLIAISSHDYGLPDVNDISQNEAYKIAAEFLSRYYGINAEVIELYDEWYTTYDITANSSGQWNVFFYPSGKSLLKLVKSNMDEQRNIRYKVEIDPKSGEILNSFDFVFVATDDLQYLQQYVY